MKGLKKAVTGEGKGSQMLQRRRRRRSASRLWVDPRLRWGGLDATRGGRKGDRYRLGGEESKLKKEEPYTLGEGDF